jgi:hypothetical protein
VGDSISIAEPGGGERTDDRRDGRLPPGATSTSFGRAPPPASRAKPRAEPSMPSTGTRSHTPGRRAARAAAAANAASGCSEPSR